MGIYTDNNSACPELKYISANPGSGKTFTAVKDLVVPGIRRGEKWLVAQPTKELINDTVESALLKFCPNAIYKVITSDTDPYRVAQTLSEHIEEAVDGIGEVVFVTHAVFHHLKWLVKEDAWNLIVDEEPQIVKILDTRIPDNKSALTDCIELGYPMPDGYGSYTTYCSVKITDHAKLEKIAKNKNKDEIWDVLREVAQALLNDNYLTFVNAEQYNRFGNGEQQSLSIFCLLVKSMFTGWASVRFLSANFEDTMTYQMWRDDFAWDESFIGRLRGIEYDDENIEIYYAHDGYNTKNLNREYEIEDKEIAGALELFGAHEPFLVHFNKKGEAELDWWEDRFKGTNAVVCPRMPHGLNSFAEINNIIFLSALNPKDHHLDFLRDFGVREVSNALYHQNGFQAVMRLSVRNPENQARKRIVVVDKPFAEYLQKQFPRAKLIKLGDGIVPDDVAERQQWYRDAKRRQTELLEELCGNRRSAEFLRGGK
jgi:hypothetical protein